jgi:hypothetical protein
MQTYIVRVYRARPEDEGSVSGMIEDIETGHKELFKNQIDLQSKLAHFIGKGQLELPDFATQELNTSAPVAMTG